MKFSTKTDADTFYDTGWTFIRHVVDIAREPFVILDNDLRVVSANDSFYRKFLVTDEETEGKLVFDLGNGQWNSPQLRKLLENILPKSTFFKDFEVEHEFPLIGKKIMMINARIMFGREDKIPLIIMAIEDVTKQKLLEDKLKDYAKLLETKVMEQTKAMELRIAELEIMNKATISRELRMVELKEEMEKMKKSITHMK
jgi:hypothetical protein